MAAFAVWLGVETHRAREQERAVHAVQRLGGRVGYSDEVLAGLTVSKARGSGAVTIASSMHKLPPGDTSWIEQFLGEHYFRRVDEIGVSGPEVTDGLLPRIAALSRLRLLSLHDAPVTDEGLAHLEGLASLEVLILDRTRITDRGLEHLRGLTNLEMLSLNGTDVSDAGLKHLAGLTKLRVLHLGMTHPDGSVYGTKITDAGLEHVAGLASLEVVSIGGTGVTSAGEQELHKALPNVTICH